MNGLESSSEAFRFDSMVKYSIGEVGVIADTLKGTELLAPNRSDILLDLNSGLRVDFGESEK